MKATDFSWYHRIDLGNGEVTLPSTDYEQNWELTRAALTDVDYNAKSVLDIASWDGAWAFFAERRGASKVVAVDSISITSPRRDISQALDKMLYAREKLGSRVLPYYDRSIHSLTTLLPLTGPFDIIHNLGLLYHLENPWHAIKQCRRVINTGGVMIVETAYDSAAKNASMLMNAGPTRFYDDDASYWAPSLECLKEMLKACFFDLDMSSIFTLAGPGRVHRIACRAIALPIIGSQVQEFENDYRTGITP